MKILIIRGSAIGDIVEDLPVAAALKQLYGGDCQLTWLVKRKFAGIIQGNAHLDQVLLYEDFKDIVFRSSRLMAKRKLVEVETPAMDRLLSLSKASRLQEYAFDLVLDLHGTYDSRMYARATGCQHCLTPAFLKNEEGLYSSLEHRVVENMEIITQLEPHFPVAEFLQQVDFGWRLGGYAPLAGQDYVVLVLSTTWPSKNYPPRLWLQVINQLATSGRKLVFLGGKGDQPIVDYLEPQLQNSHCVNLVGKTSLQEMLSLLSKAQLVVGGDTGPMHIAASMGVRTLTLMGPTYAGKCAPFGSLATVLEADCPCRNCHLEHCPNGICCMEYLPPERVVSTMKELLS